MKWTESAMGVAQFVQLLVTIGLAILGFMLTRQQSQSNEAIAQIETQLKVKQDDRAATESVEKVRFQLFGHVSQTLEKKENSGKQVLAAKALVVSLLRDDDPLRIGLLEALATDANPETKMVLDKVTAQEREYRAQEDAVVGVVSALQKKNAGVSAKSLHGYLVDVFYCEKDAAVQKSRAGVVEDFLKGESIKSRGRLLAESVNSSPGMRVSGLQIRYNDDELGVAQELQALLARGEKWKFTLRQVKQPTPNYLSVFLCS